MADFKIGEPVDMPIGGRGEWGLLLEQVREMTDGKVLPLEFEDVSKALTFAQGRSGSFRKRGVRTQRRGNVVYLSKLDPS